MSAEWQRVIVDAYMSASLSGQSIRFVGHDADKYEAEVLQRLRRMTGIE